MAFFVLPATIVMLAAAAAKAPVSPKVNPGVSFSVLSISYACAVFVVILLGWSFRLRRKAGTLDSSSVLVGSWPKEDRAFLKPWQRVVMILFALGGIVALGVGLWNLR
jgi:hypothetical protein